MNQGLKCARRAGETVRERVFTARERRVHRALRARAGIASTPATRHALSREIGERNPARFQAKILRVLQEASWKRERSAREKEREAGWRRPNRNLRDEGRCGAYARNRFLRLSVFPISNAAVAQARRTTFRCWRSLPANCLPEHWQAQSRCHGWRTCSGFQATMAGNVRELQPYSSEPASRHRREIASRTPAQQPRPPASKKCEPTLAGEHPDGSADPAARADNIRAAFESRAWKIRRTWRRGRPATDGA